MEKPNKAATYTTSKGTGSNGTLSIITPFTPTIMDEQTLRDIFVARERLVERIVRDVDDATTSGARRHTLLIGPRGIGKTHLVSMVYYTLKADKQLYDHLRIAWLREEEWSIFSYADLLVRIFRALANEYPEERTELNAFADTLMRMPVEEGGKVGEARLLSLLENRILVLIAENINDIFENIGVEGQRSLRAFLQNYSRVVLITTSPSLTDDLSSYDAPFYGFFNTTHLKELTRAEAKELLHRIATRNGDAKLATYLETEEADRRLRVIELLAGGHPRIWVLFSACMSSDLLDELVPLFIKMLDDLTPYYQERMRSLPPQERRIVAFLCERSGAVAVREIAEYLRLKPNATAVWLGLLEEKAYIRKAPELSIPAVGDRRVSYYEMREPLMRLCIEVKENRAEPLRLIVEFLRLWFRQEELHNRLRALPSNALLTRQYMEATLERIAIVRSEVDRLVGEAIIHGITGNPVQALRSCDDALALDPGNANTWHNRGVTLSQLNEFEEALESFDRAIAINPESTDYWLNRGVALVQLNRDQEALEGFGKAVSLDSQNANAWANYGGMLYRLNRPREALESLDKAIAIDPLNATIWYNRGVMLGQLQQPTEALESFSKVISLEPLDADAWVNRGASLGELKRYDEAFNDIGTAISLNPHNFRAWYNRGMMLGQLNRFEESLAAFDQAVTVDAGIADAWRGKILALISLGRFDQIDTPLAKLLSIQREVNNLPSLVHWLLLHLLQTGSTQDRWNEFIRAYTQTFAQGNALPDLAHGLALVIANLLNETITNSGADLWLAAWEKAAGDKPEMDLAMRLLRAAVEWKRTRDRGALLRLASEEREILEQLIAEAETAKVP